MYQFIKNLIPTKKQEKEKNQKKEEINEAVQEAKQEVDSIEDVEYEASRAINQTSSLLDKLEADRKTLFKQVEELEAQLKFLSQHKLNEKQSAERDKLENILITQVKPALVKTDNEIDNLTKKLLILYAKRDSLSQKKVFTEDEISNASKVQQIDNNSEPLSTISNNNNNNNNNNNDKTKEFQDIEENV
ncbi:hypothetical protein DLAC_11446 [Tieghemostelium lacteum]|uniref:Uncharacterized protein n=1 Tax=Tieghemostelium lacteum TaxID=361077 RepID=A0A152AAE1_TIELA|nr:hypothetical protein DLAC_11446 [Tieghemostelium lacteum]|eukprot:KYR03105.1 hypothetical protein DLAC_11446 [Tieghemostelium lacteum]